jgi:ferrous iron transport protein B
MHHHNSSTTQAIPSIGSIALIGHPNVGKSVLFQRLTGQHVIISNYPGTTVEVARGASRAFPRMVLVDTPGVITFPPHSDDEQVTARVLLEGDLKAILQVGDAKNLRRTLLLTVQLAEMGIPLVLALNMMDEAQARGVAVDHACLEERLGCSVVPTTAIRGQGVEALVGAVNSAVPPLFGLDYGPEIEAALAGLVESLQAAGLPALSISLRSLALLWLSADPVSDAWLQARLNAAAFSELCARRDQAQASIGEPLSRRIQRIRLEFVEQIASNAFVQTAAESVGLSERLGRLTTDPVWGLLVLVGVLYGLYWFVGVWGAGTLVSLLEGRLFGQVINPWAVETVHRLVPVPLVADFLVGEYGVWTMGMTYALALILPIVTTFFLAFGVMEDSGYLPRLAALSNRLFKALGLNGKAVLPMVLGLGCVTMATLTTRVLESKRERLLVTLLLALAVPCSAQLGVVMGMLAGISLMAVIIWGGVVTLVLILVGWLAARLVPGERTQLLVELPPMRLPVFSNVLVKTLARLEWYLKEVVPLFLFGTIVMFALDKLGWLAWMIHAGEPLVNGWLGLPPQASAAFLMGFLRRDFGATGLFVMQSQGLLTPVQVVVAMVTITLFVPCVASVMMIAKERGWRTALGMLLVIFPLAFVTGGLLDRLLQLVGWG